MSTITLPLEKFEKMNRMLRASQRLIERARRDGLTLAEKLALQQKARRMRERAMAIR